MKWRLGNFWTSFDGPRLAEGYLPGVELAYHHADGDYFQETFASTVPVYASSAVSLTRFRFKPSPSVENGKGRMTVRIDSLEKLTVDAGRVLDKDGKVLLWFDGVWKWEPGRRALVASFANGSAACLAVAGGRMDASSPTPLAAAGFDAQRQKCIETWQKILRQGMRIEVPEPYVNNAWRALVIANFSLINGDRMFYSAGNQYEKLYEQEGSAAAMALLAYGYEADTRRLLPPLLEFTRKGLEYHQAGFKLEDICHYYWQTRDADFVRSLRPKWQKEVDRLAENRSPTNGLYPREQYCGDIPTPVFSLNSNAKGWQALRDTSMLLQELGDDQEAKRLRGIAADFRKDIEAAIRKSMKGEDTFIPNALMGEEKPYDVITATRMGSYWNLMANNILGTGILGQGSRLEDCMVDYLRAHGGLCMGLVRSRAWPAFWVGTANLNPLYGWPYVETVMRRDEPDRALVGFYGMLAAGMTPDTFICGEACALEPVDKWGRQFYCPPNSAGNAFFLQMLRNVLVQDFDLDEDGEPDALRLLFDTPKSWLSDGQMILVERAPTAFGPVSMRVSSQLSHGEVTAEVSLPERNPPMHSALRIRLPDGWHVQAGHVRDQTLEVDKQGTVRSVSVQGKNCNSFQSRPALIQYPDEKFNRARMCVNHFADE